MTSRTDIALVLLCLTLSLLALLRVHIRTKTTLIGYQTGRLQAKEIMLMQERNLLTAQLAQLTSKKSLVNKINGR